MPTRFFRLHPLLGLALALLALIAPQQASAKVYKWTDAKGVLHFSDRPPQEAPAEQVQLLPSNSYRGPETDIPATDEPAPRPAAPASTGTKPVVMFSAQWCGYCRKARSYFQSNRIRFRERDIEKDATAEREYKRLGGNGVPLILVGEQRMDGFSEDSFRRLYDR